MSVYGAPGQDEDPGLTARREECHGALARIPMPSAVPPGMRLRECKEPGWQILQPELLLAPMPVLTAMEQWAHTRRASEQD